MAGNKKYCADAVILATGGKAAAVLGSDGSGYALANNLVIRFLRLSLHLYNFAGKAPILNRWRASHKCEGIRAGRRRLSGC